jgi:hypothetical protein
MALAQDILHGFSTTWSKARRMGLRKFTRLLHRIIYTSLAQNMLRGSLYGSSTRRLAIYLTKVQLDHLVL